MRTSRYLATRLAAIAVAVMLPLFVVVVERVATNVEVAERSAGEALAEQAARAAVQVDAALARAVRVLEFAAGRLNGTAVDQESCMRALEGLVEVDPLVGNLGASDTAGRALCMLVPMPGGRLLAALGGNAGDADVARAAASETTFVSRPFRSPVSGQPALMMTTPLRDVDGRRIGLVGARVDLTRLDDLLASLERPADGTLTVLDSDGQVVRRLGAPDAPAAGQPAAGGEWLQSEATVGAFGWRVVTAVPRAVVLAPVNERAAVAAAAVLAATLLGVLVALAFARRLGRPLADLLQATRAQADGQGDARADERAPAEFGQLAAEFNRLVAQRRDAAGRLAEQERRYADLFAGVPLAGAMIDAQGRVVFVNDHLLAVTGWRRDELLGRDLHETLLPQRPHERGDGLERLGADAQGGSEELTIATRNGAPRVMNSFRLPLRSADGAFAGVAIISEDITEQRAVEAKVARLAAFDAALSRTGEALVQQLDEQKLFEEICRIFAETGHADRADLIGVDGDTAWLVAQSARVPLFDQTLFPTRFSLSERAYLLTSQAILTGKAIVCADYANDARTETARRHGYGLGYRSLAVLPLRRHGQVAFALVLFAEPAGLFDDDVVALLQRMTTVVSFALDQRAAEDARARALAEAQAGLERFRRLFYGAPAPLVITDIADQGVQEVNDAACRLYGLERAQLLGRSVAPLGRGLSQADRRTLVEALRRDGRVRGMELVLTGANDQPRVILASAELIDWEGRQRMLAMAQDITELRQSERAREQMEAAQQASAAKTEFISRMSHELRTPLNAVIGFAQLLQESAESMTPHQRQQLQRLLDGSMHLQALVDDAVDLASIEAGRLKVASRPLESSQVIESTLALCAAAAAKAGVEVYVDVEGVAGVQVLADPTRLRQVLANLVSNGIKYNRRGGRVTVSAQAAGPEVRFEVEDDGLGMTHPQQDRLFTPYDRLDREHSGIAGTGIGLALSRQLVEMMGGTLRVDSEPDQGTRVVVQLPRASAPVGAATAAGGLHQSPGEAHGLVLYIEDEPVNRLLVKEALRSCAGLELLVAEDGRSGVELARRRRPDLVLLDMHLPDLDGSAVMRELRADPATRALPVVALSASAMSEDVDVAMASGVAEYWSKPIDLHRLRQDVRRLLASAAAHHED